MGDLELAAVNSAERVAIVEVRLHATEIALQKAVARRVAGPRSEHRELDRFVGHAGHARDRLELTEVRTGISGGLAGCARLGRVGGAPCVGRGGVDRHGVRTRDVGRLRLDGLGRRGGCRARVSGRVVAAVGARGERETDHDDQRRGVTEATTVSC